MRWGTCQRTAEHRAVFFSRNSALRGVCGGRNHLKRRSLAACRGPSASTHFLGYAPYFSDNSTRFLRRRGETRPEFSLARLSEFQRSRGEEENPPRAQLSKPRQAREGLGEGSSAGVYPAALPNAPKRRVVAARRAYKPWSEGRGENNRRRLSRFSPHILYRRFQLKVHTNRK